jgi:hypothetical protein
VPDGAGLPGATPHRRTRPPGSGPERRVRSTVTRRAHRKAGRCPATTIPAWANERRICPLGRRHKGRLKVGCRARARTAGHGRPRRTPACGAAGVELQPGAGCHRRLRPRLRLHREVPLRESRPERCADHRRCTPIVAATSGDGTRPRRGVARGHRRRWPSAGIAAAHPPDTSSAPTSSPSKSRTVQISGWSGVVPRARYLLILRTASVRSSRFVPTRRLSAMRVPSIMPVSFPVPHAAPPVRTWHRAGGPAQPYRPLLTHRSPWQDRAPGTIRDATQYLGFRNHEPCSEVPRTGPESRYTFMVLRATRHQEIPAT